MSKQPRWRMIANLGDASPFDHGGYFVYVDESGTYPPEAEVLEPPMSESPGRNRKYTVYSFPLETCVMVGGILSDNPECPEHAAWFAKSITGIASTIGCDPDELVSWLCSSNPIARAQAYRAIGEWNGWENLDEYPLYLTQREVWGRYTSGLRSLRRKRAAS